MREAVSRINGIWKAIQAAAMVAALLAWMGTRALAEGPGTGVVSVCVKTADGAMRMIMGSSHSSAKNCGPGEQFMQWKVLALVSGTSGAGRSDARDATDQTSAAKPASTERAARRPGPEAQAAVLTRTSSALNAGGARLVRTSGGQGPGPTNSITAPFYIRDSGGTVIFSVEDKASGGTVQTFGHDGHATTGMGSGTTGNPEISISDGSKGGIVMTTPQGGGPQITFTSNGRGKILLGYDSQEGLPSLAFDSIAGTETMQLAARADHAFLRFKNQSNSAVSLGFAADGYRLEFDSGSSSKVAEIAGGNQGQIGFRIFDGGAELVSLEKLPAGNGGGGLKIGNAAGGTAATIAPNKAGVGVFYGLTMGGGMGLP